MTMRAASIFSKYPLVLGSQSSTRRAMLLEAIGSGVPIHIIPPKIDEAAIGDRHAGAANARELVLELGKAKATRILEILHERRRTSSASTLPPCDNSKTCACTDSAVLDNAIIVTGDQVVTCKGEILEKPADKAEAKRFYKEYYSGSQCSTVGSIVLTHVGSGTSVSSVDVGTVHYSSIDAAVVDEVVDNAAGVEENEVLMYCCGGLMIEHSVLGKFITQLEGGEDTVLGLCKESLLRLGGELEDKLNQEAAGVR